MKDEVGRMNSDESRICRSYSSFSLQPLPLHPSSFGTNQPVAQSEEHLPSKQTRGGSTPPGLTQSRRTPTGRGTAPRTLSVEVRVLPATFNFGTVAQLAEHPACTRVIGVQIPAAPLQKSRKTRKQNNRTSENGNSLPSVFDESHFLMFCFSVFLLFCFSELLLFRTQDRG